MLGCRPRGDGWRSSACWTSSPAASLRLALEGIDSGMERELSDAERLFFTLPLGHSEDLALHERGSLASSSAIKRPSVTLAGVSS